MESTHKFTIGEGIKLSAIKNNAALQTSLDSLSKGGAPIFEWYKSDLSALNRLYSEIATGGDTVWLDGEDIETGLPTRYVVIGDSILNLGMYVTDEGKQVLKNGTGETGAQAYGFSYLTLITNSKKENERTTQVATNMLNYEGDGIPKIEVGEGLKNLIEKNVGVVLKFIKKMIDLAFESGEVGGPAAANAAIRDNAEQAAAESGEEDVVIAIEGEETIVAEVGFGIAEGVEIVFGLGELAMTIIFNLLAKEILNYVRFYNHTSVEIDFSICWVHHDDAVVSSPVLPLDPVYIPGLSPAWTPPWVIGHSPIHYANMVFGNTDNLRGVAYVLKARPNGDFPGFNVAVNIPNTGANSLGISFETEDNCDQYWNEHQGQSHDLSLCATSSTGKYTLNIATNQVKGKSPSPIDNTNGYNYEHLILLTEK